MNFEEAYYVTPENSMHVKIVQKDLFRAQKTQLMFDDDNLETWVICKPQVNLGQGNDA